MVKSIDRDQGEYYQCEECGFWYEDKEWADKCQEWCREHQSCNLEILKHGVPDKNVE